VAPRIELHLLGRTTANAPKTQITRKIEPIKGLRKMKLSTEADELRTSSTNEINPKIEAETNESNVMFEGWLLDTGTPLE
jgi:hypothetical protein